MKQQVTVTQVINSEVYIDDDNKILCDKNCMHMEPIVFGYGDVNYVCTLFKRV